MRKLFVSRLSSLGYSRASQAQIILSFVPSSTKSLCFVLCASRSTKLGDLGTLCDSSLDAGTIPNRCLSTPKVLVDIDPAQKGAVDESSGNGRPKV